MKPSNGNNARNVPEMVGFDAISDSWKYQQTPNPRSLFLCLSSRLFKLHLSPKEKQKDSNLFEDRCKRKGGSKGSGVGQKDTYINT